MAVATDSAGVALGVGKTEGVKDASALETGDVTHPKSKKPKSSKTKARAMTKLTASPF